MDKFGWSPLQPMGVEATPRVTSVAFGDGYEQRAPNGINNLLKKYSVKFKGDHEDMQALVAFLEDKGGVAAFLFTPPGEWVTKKVVCRAWKPNVLATKIEVSATFEEVVA
ncbi:hypothetical protein A1OW_20950 [Enterovibrio norvegicus]|uniref:phage tail protein n=1 Tax=Enterovibrio norvegicus TaxID=188144 RepID=UPI0002E2E59A|nr:phage tail protein [Enterovibrio norvegicus]OEF60155.1 hypothetical protein A1OW_20950 [Enterovibrio norvegicus]